MSRELDELMHRVLDGARAGAQPTARELATAFDGVRQRLQAPPSTGHASGPSDAAAREFWTGAGRARRAGTASWSRIVSSWRWLVAVAGAGAVGFLVGEHHGRGLAVPGEVPVASPPVPHERAERPPAAPLALASPELPASSNDAGEEKAESAPHPARVASAGLGRRRPRAVRARPKMATADSPSTAAAPTEPTSSSSRDEPTLAVQEFTFSEILSRLARAQRAQRRSEPALALALLDQIDSHAAPSVLREERLTARVLAACDAGDVPQAERAAAELSASAESSVYASRLAESCVAGAIPAAAGRRRFSQ